MRNKIGLCLSSFAGLVAGVFICASSHAQSCDSLFASDVLTTLDYYNSHAVEYNETRAHVSPELAKQREQFLTMLPKGARILEIGAGHGRDALYFQDLGFDVVATEPSLELAKLAGQKLGQPVLNTRAQDLKYEEEFDAVWASASLIHVPPQELALVFGNLKRALKPGGVIHASFLKGVGTADVPEQIADGRYFNRASESSLRDVVRKVGGLTVVEDLSRAQSDDYFGTNAPSSTFGFFNLVLKRDRAVAYPTEKIEIRLGTHKVAATLVRHKEHWSFFRADRILADFDKDRSIIIGLNGIHTYLYYRGQLIDSYGYLGGPITSRIRKSELIYGDLLLVIRDLPDEARANLEAELAKFKASAKATCVRHTCTYLNTLNPSWLNSKNFYRFSSLFETVARLKNEQTIDVEVIALTPDAEARYALSRQTEMDVGAFLTNAIKLLRSRLGGRP